MLAALKFLVGSCQHVFLRYYYKNCITVKKGDVSSSILEKNNLHQQKARKKLNIRHLNGHLDFSSGFQVIDPSGYEKITSFPLMQVIFSKIELEISLFLTVIQFYSNMVEKRVGKSPQEISTRTTFRNILSNLKGTR